MVAPYDSPIPTGNTPPKAQFIWQCPSCSRRYLTEEAPARCPYCLQPVKS